MKFNPTLLTLFGILLSLATSANAGEKIDVSKGFAGAEWGMSLEAVEKAVPGTERNTTDRFVDFNSETEILKLKGEDPIVATYFLFLEDQMVAVVRLLEGRVLEETTVEALCRVLAKQFVPNEAIGLGFEWRSIWGNSFFKMPIQGNQRRVGLSTSQGSQQRRRVVTVGHPGNASPPAAPGPSPSPVQLVISNQALQKKILEKQALERLEKERIAAEKLAPILLAP